MSQPKRRNTTATRDNASSRKKFHGNDIVASLHGGEGEKVSLLEEWRRDRMQTAGMRVERDIRMRGRMSCCSCKAHPAFAEGLLCDICGHEQCAVCMSQLARRRTQE